jgi:hypothetical protein
MPGHDDNNYQPNARDASMTVEASLLGRIGKFDHYTRPRPPPRD